MKTSCTIKAKNISQNFYAKVPKGIDKENAAHIIQLPVASCQLPVASCQLPVASCQLPVASCNSRFFKKILLLKAKRGYEKFLCRVFVFKYLEKTFKGAALL